MSGETPSPASGADGRGACIYAEVIVSGRVQGVGYREFTRRAAERLGVAGFVRNRADGTVEARLIGAAEAVEGLLAQMRRGPPGASVAQVRVDARGASEAQSGFFVTATA